MKLDPDDLEALRDMGQRLSGKQTPATPTDTGTAPQPPAGPIIPRQEQQPNLQQGPSPEERFVNQLFNAGTIREYL